MTFKKFLTVDRKAAKVALFSEQLIAPLTKPPTDQCARTHTSLTKKIN